MSYYNSNAVNFIRPTSKVQSNLMPLNIGIPALSRRMPVNKLINKKITKINNEKDTLLNLLKEKEQEELDTLQNIELDRRQREEAKLNQIHNDIAILESKLAEKKNLEIKIRELYDNQKKTNLNTTLHYIENRKKKLSDELLLNEDEFNKVRENELLEKKKEKERAIIRDFEKKQQAKELETRKLEKELMLKRQEEKTEQELQSIKLKYLKENLQKIKEDLQLKENQEQLLNRKKQLLHLQKNKKKDEKIEEKETKPVFTDSNKISTDHDEIINVLPFIRQQKKQNESLNKEKLNTSQIFDENSINNIIDQFKNNIEDNHENKSKIDLLEHLVKDISLTKKPITNTISKEDIEKQKIKENNLEKINRLPDLVVNANNTPLMNLMQNDDEDDDEDFMEILDKINNVNIALSSKK